MMTAEQLKASILQMAMQGKLVEQRPEEETGEELYKEIQAEKKKLIKEGKIKNQKPLSDISEAEIPFDIPDTWKWVRLGDITELIMGQSPKGENVFEGGQGIEFHQGKIHFSDDYLLESTLTTNAPTKIVESNTVLLCVRAPVGTVNITPRTICIGRGLCGVRVFGGMDPYFMLNWLRAIKDSFVKKATGTTFIAITGKVVEEEVIPLPPLAEQKRIVAKIEELMPFMEQYAAANTKLNTLNASFPEMMKKSILQEAVQGKLVPQDPNDEPASVLLKKIAEEKKRLIKEGKIKKQKPLPEITEDEIPFDIPESWEWVRLGTVITDTEAGKSPQCKNRPAKNEEWGVIKTTAIQDGYFLKEENKVLPEGFEIKEAQIIHAEDLLITRAGPQNRTGITCIVEEEPERLILSDKTVRLAYLKGLVNHKYLMYVIKSPAVQSFVSATKSGMAASQVNISQDKMKLFIIPLPPLEEQDRIVTALDRVLPELRFK